MNCADAELLVLLMDSGEISTAQHHDLVDHLKDCEACRTLSREMASLRQTYATETDPHPGPSQQTLTRIRKAAKQHHTRRFQIIHHPWPIAIAAAASLIFCFATLRFANTSPPRVPALSAQGSHAVEIIPLIAMITGREPNQITMEGDETELTVLADELLRLQDMAIDWPGETKDSLILPEDYLPTTLQWNNTHGSLSEIYG